MNLTADWTMKNPGSVNKIGKQEISKQTEREKKNRGKLRCDIKDR